MARSSIENARAGRRSGERGQSLLEFAAVVPIFLLVVMGVIDFGVGLKSWIQVTNAAREAARFGAVYCSQGDIDGTPVSDLVVDRAVESATGLELDTANISVSANCDAGHATESLSVSIEYDYEMISPIGGMMSFLGGGIPSTITLTSSADMRIE
jgi:Flp pilus assembly protein TadG